MNAWARKPRATQLQKQAGLDDSAKMDELASGICSRIESGKADTVGPWMKDTFTLEVMWPPRWP